LIRENGKLVELDFDSVSSEVNNLIISNIKKHGRKEIGCLISGQSTSEELFLFQKIFKGLEISNIDHRTKERDFSYQKSFPIMPSLGCNIDDLHLYKNIILIGVNVKTEYPILSVRLNNATKGNSKIYSFNFSSLDENFPLYYKKVIDDNNIEPLLNTNDLGLDNGETLIILGPLISRLPNQSNILKKVHDFSLLIDAKVGFLAEFCNSTSGWLLGNLPHRNLGGSTSNIIGKNSYEMITEKLSTYIMYNLEPESDFFDKTLVEVALKSSECNIFFTSYITPMMEKYADIIIPITTFAETDGSYINIEGRYQVFQPVVQPSKDIHEGWSILNNISILNNFGDYTIDTIRNELEESLKKIDFSLSAIDIDSIDASNMVEDNVIDKFTRDTYDTDMIVRRSESLNKVSLSKHKPSIKNITNEPKNI